VPVRTFLAARSLSLTPWLPQRELAQPRDSRVQTGANFLSWLLRRARKALFKLVGYIICSIWSAPRSRTTTSRSEVRCPSTSMEKVDTRLCANDTVKPLNRTLPVTRVDMTVLRWACAPLHLTRPWAGARPSHSIAYDVASISARIRSTSSASIDAAESCCGSATAGSEQALAVSETE
jgi:hypothetical protein